MRIRAPVRRAPGCQEGGAVRGSRLHAVTGSPGPLRAARDDSNRVSRIHRLHTPGVRGHDNATVRLDLDNEPQPDVLLYIEEEAGGQSCVSDDGYLEGAPELVVEVAASSASVDMHDKLRVYRRNGVREYSATSSSRSPTTSNGRCERSDRRAPFGGRRDGVGVRTAKAPGHAPGATGVPSAAGRRRSEDEVVLVDQRSVDLLQHDTAVGALHPHHRMALSVVRDREVTPPQPRAGELQQVRPVLEIDDILTATRSTR